MAIVKGGSGGADEGVGDNANSVEGFEDEEFAAQLDIDDGGVPSGFEGDAAGSGNVVPITRKDDGRVELVNRFARLSTRARELRKGQYLQLTEPKFVGQPGAQTTIYPNNDLNLDIGLRALFDGAADRPYFDEFRGRVVSWDGKPLDANTNIIPLLEAFGAMNMPTPTADRATAALNRYARTASRNSLTDGVESRMVAWDGVSRIDSYMIGLFDSHDTELTREFWRYFWLSLYNRVFNPGCLAPIVLCMFSHQGSGKSFFAKKICQEILGNMTSEPVPLDLSANENDFLRKITGKTVIASIPEMHGFGRAALTKVKDFTTKQTDMLDYKYQDAFEQPRQWIITMDGNEYVGLQRDDTGNRRFYPVFLGQEAWDWDKKTCWREDFVVNFGDGAGFRASFWQIMAECRAWMAENGSQGYDDVVRALIPRVAAFSAAEMAADRGTVRDDDMDTLLQGVLSQYVVPDFIVPKDTGRPPKYVGAFVSNLKLSQGIKNASIHGFRVNAHTLKRKMEAAGAKADKWGNVRGYVFPGVNTIEEWEKIIDGDTQNEDGELVSGASKAKVSSVRGGDGGF